jgi:hypothetical protein
MPIAALSQRGCACVAKVFIIGLMRPDLTQLESQAGT